VANGAGVLSATNFTGDVTAVGSNTFGAAEEAQTILGPTTFGVSGTGVDILWYTDTAGDFVLFDQNGQTNGAIISEDVTINLRDSTILSFGDGAGGTGDGDVTISSSSANLLTIGQTVAGTGSVAVGANDAGLDWTFYGDTTSQYLMWDTSEDTLTGNLGNVLFTTVDAEVNQFKVDATGIGAGNVIVLETTDGGVQINADGAENGDIGCDRHGQRGRKCNNQRDCFAGGRCERNERPDSGGKRQGAGEQLHRHPGSYAASGRCRIDLHVR